MKNILVVGSINIDLVMNTERVARVGETVRGTSFNTIAGGKGANQAVAAARLGAKVKMLGAVGNDAYGNVLVEGMQKDGIDVSGIERFDTSTGVAVIVVCNGDNSIIINAGANACVTPEYIDRHIDAIEWADFVIMQYEIPMETVLHTARIAHELGKIVVINPAPMTETPDELIKICDLFVPNQTEANALLGEECDEQTAVKKIKELGAKSVLMTLGSKGSLMFDGRDMEYTPAVKVEAVDSTAAGDCFIGALVTALSEDKPMKEAVRFATKAASVSVTRSGAQTSLPYRREI